MGQISCFPGQPDHLDWSIRVSLLGACASLNGSHDRETRRGSSAVFPQPESTNVLSESEGPPGGCSECTGGAMGSVLPHLHVSFSKGACLFKRTSCPEVQPTTLLYHLALSSLALTAWLLKTKF